MLSQAEQSVYEKHRDDAVLLAGAVLKSCVMLALLVLLAWIGVESKDEAPSDPNTYATAMTHGQRAPENASARHRKVVFDERRSRWDDKEKRAANADTTASR